MKAAVIGLWHQGVVGAACLADLGFEVVAADADAAKIAKLSEAKAPLFEPGLDDLLAKGMASKKLSFTSDLAKAVAETSLIFWMFDTTVNDADESDLSDVFAAARAIAPAVQPGSILFSSVQAPVGTMDKLAAEMHEINPKAQFTTAYTPENLRLGEAIERFRHPPLPVIGSDDPATLDKLSDVLSGLAPKWHRVSLRTGEMIKHALNGYLALSLTFANELGNLCDEVGADGKAVGDMLKLDPRVCTKAMLMPGLGFAGGTLARDVQTLRGLGDAFKIETPLLDGLWRSNQQQNQLVMRKLKAEFGDVTGKTVAILGLTYKPGTSALRRSAAIEIANELTANGATVRGHDPKADREELAGLSDLDFTLDAYAAVKDSDAVVLMTPWPDYKSIDFAELKKTMRRPFVIDTAGMWNHKSAEDAGLTYRDIGRGRAKKAAKGS